MNFLYFSSLFNPELEPITDSYFIKVIGEENNKNHKEEKEDYFNKYSVINLLFHKF